MSRNVITDLAITIVGEMYDSSFEHSVVYVLTASHLTLNTSVVSHVATHRILGEESLLLQSLVLTFVFGHKLGPWLDWFGIR